jgi:CTP:molybdopterin cytidylyltransferase MocA
MTTAAILLAAGSGSRFSGPAHKLRADLHGRPVLGWSLEAVILAGFDDVIVVTGDDPFEDLLPDSVVRVSNQRWDDGQATSLHAGIEMAQVRGHDAVVVGLADQPLVGRQTWRDLRVAESHPIAVATYAGTRRPPTRLASSVWGSLPTEGDIGARVLFVRHPELLIEVPSAGDPTDVDTEQALSTVRQRAADVASVTDLLGREPMGPFEVVVRDQTGSPVVLKNYPMLADGRPMPTLYWLCGRRESMLVGRLESMKGVRRAEAEVGLDSISKAHEQYRIERDAILEASGASPVHRPTGGVGGTRTGVKCLHAHYGWWLAGGDDPVGQWVADHLHEVDSPTWPSESNEAS